ncbi:FAD-binding oxidoreductase [Brevundimonas sp.]|uniref:FAD-binding oxidoreductase n=1 Tax=Brevundimonas sp. TaxID=1871086 RepID=UPI002CAB6BF2|nr:FAD-linked oxidase C-terminal domain-containing protein [Brevundimonas sp.]HWQ87311.1 FAD-linked oxidase C-terminal domain-containing protein [Brevundimonas sp.]
MSDPVVPASLPEALIRVLTDRLGEHFTVNPVVRAHHGGGGTRHPNRPPQAVAFPDTTAAVAEVVQACAAHGVAIVPYGAGTSLEGHVAAMSGGVTIDLSRMNRVLRVGVDDFDCTVEAGVTRSALNAHLRDTGLFFPVDPGADATLGGMAATRASGTTTVRYGGMRENVMALTVVTAAGEVIRTARRARKSSAGYDLTHLFVGSEGTLGVITEVTLRLHPVPETMAAAVCAFPSAEAAVRTVIEALQSGLVPARAEYLDPVQMGAVNRAFGLDYAVADSLFLEFHGGPDEVGVQARMFGELAEANGGSGFQWAVEPEARDRLWKARHQAGFAALSLRPGAIPWSTDVCVPISRLAQCVMETRADLDGAPFPGTMLGHVGDGNFHCILLLNPDDPAEMAAAAGFDARLVRRALAMDGTCTGEHGIGLGKQAALVHEMGDAVGLMRAIKHALDPEGLLNPGKIFVAG